MYLLINNQIKYFEEDNFTDIVIRDMYNVIVYILESEFEGYIFRPVGKTEDLSFAGHNNNIGGAILEVFAYNIGGFEHFTVWNNNVKITML